MNKIITVIIAAIIVILLAVWAFLFWKPAKTTPEPLNQQTLAVDSTTSIDKDLQAIEVENLDADFGEFDKDIESL